MTLRLGNVTIDCDDVSRVANFWSAALDRPLDEGASGFFASIGMNDPSQPRWLFIKVPEPKTAKNRVHIDVPCGVERHSPKLEQLAAIEAKVAELVEAGGTEGESHSEFGAVWTVMQDPEGNEFCVV